MTTSKSVVSIGKIQSRILLIRGEKVIIDSDLAEFYCVPTKRLNEQIKRNKNRFTEDFLYQLSAKEKSEVDANCDHLSKLKYSKTLPFAFTEHGAIMAASVLNSKQAVEVSVFVVRAFIKLRRMIAGHKELARKISQIETRLAAHDEQLLSLVKAIKQIINPVQPNKKHRIGFKTKK